MGKGRTTTGMVCACLIQDAKRQLAGNGVTKGTPRDGHEYELIDKLCDALPSAEVAKHRLDEILDLCSGMQNLRECIGYAKQMYDKETEDRRTFWKRMAVNFIERRIYLVAFATYVYGHADKDYDVTFVEFCTRHHHVLQTLARDVPKFNWE